MGDAADDLEDWAMRQQYEGSWDTLFPPLKKNGVETMKLADRLREYDIAEQDEVIEIIDALDRIRAICEDGDRSGADRLDEIYEIVGGKADA